MSNLAVEGASRKQPHSPASGSRSIGGGIVSAVVDQLRRLGSWGSPRGGSQQLPASELGLTPDQLRKASKAAPVSPPAPMTRRQVGLKCKLLRFKDLHAFL